MKWLKPAIQHRIIELEKPVPVLHKEDSKNIASLAEHPGWRALMARLRLQRAALEQLLRTQQHESLSSVHNLQARIGGIDWLEKQVKNAVGQKDASPRPAFDLEETEFQRIAAALEVIGK